MRSPLKRVLTSIFFIVMPIHLQLGARGACSCKQRLSHCAQRHQPPKELRRILRSAGDCPKMVVRGLYILQCLGASRLFILLIKKIYEVKTQSKWKIPRLALPARARAEYPNQLEYSGRKCAPLSYGRRARNGRRMAGRANTSHHQP